MREDERKHYLWIFQILAGKKPEETSIGKDKYRICEAKEFYRRINGVELENELTQKQVENVLCKNYYIGKRVYNYIINHYVSSSSIKIEIRINRKFKIEAAKVLGDDKIIIFIPDLDDEHF